MCKAPHKKGVFFESWVEWMLCQPKKGAFKSEGFTENLLGSGEKVCEIVRKNGTLNERKRGGDMSDKKRKHEQQSDKNIREELLEKFDVEPEFVDLVEEATHKYDEALRSLIDR